MLPSANQSIRLTIGGIANCPTGGNHVRTFLLLVQYAVRMEREWDYSTGEQPQFSFNDVSRAVALPIGTVGETLARQVLSVIDVEPWLGGYGGEDDDRKCVIGRPARDFAAVKTISEYWQVREARTRPASFEPGGTPTIVRPLSNRVSLEPAPAAPALYKARPNAGLDRTEPRRQLGHVTRSADRGLLAGWLVSLVIMMPN